MITRRDGEIASWIASLGAAGAPHVGERFEMSRLRVYRRLRVMTEEGLLRQNRLLYGRPGLYTATRAGLRWRGLERLEVSRIGPGSFEHAWELARVAVALARVVPERELIAERVLRVRERDEGPIASVVLARGRDGRETRHRPDLAVLCADGRAVAIEVELSVKAPGRLEAICRGYARARHIERVLYLAAPAPARALGRAVARTRTGERIEVVDLHDGEALARVEVPGGGGGGDR